MAEAKLFLVRKTNSISYSSLNNGAETLEVDLSGTIGSVSNAELRISTADAEVAALFEKLGQKFNVTLTPV
jgi:hypothetical protein